MNFKRHKAKSSRWRYASDAIYLLLSIVLLFQRTLKKISKFWVCFQNFTVWDYIESILCWKCSVPINAIFSIPANLRFPGICAIIHRIPMTTGIANLYIKVFYTCSAFGKFMTDTFISIATHTYQWGSMIFFQYHFWHNHISHILKFWVHIPRSSTLEDGKINTSWILESL